MPVIGITGFIGAGKSTAAGYLIGQHAFGRGRWAGALKMMLRAFLQYRGVPPDIIERMVDGDLKEVPSQYLGWKSPREFMEALGTGFGRDMIHPDLWVDAEFEHLTLTSTLNDRIVFEDCRYPNEAETVRRLGGLVLRIERTGLVPKGHPTERAQLEILPDRVITNTPGAPESMWPQLDAVVAELTT